MKKFIRDAYKQTTQQNRLTLYSGDLMTKEPLIEKEKPHLHWTGTGYELTELAIALIHSESVEMSNGKNTQGELGAQLFKLFNHKPGIKNKEFSFEINELKKNRDKSIYLRTLPPIVDKYIVNSTRKNRQEE